MTRSIRESEVFSCGMRSLDCSRLLIIVGGYAYYLHTERSIKAFIRSQFEAEGLPAPPEIAAVLDSQKPAKSAFFGYGTMLPDYIVLKITLGDILREYAVGLIVFVCIVSFGIAHWMNPSPPTAK